MVNTTNEGWPMTECGEYSGKKLFFKQCKSKEEAKKDKCPQGIYFYWEYDGKRIYSPMDIMRIVQNSVEDKTFAPQNMITPQALKVHYANVMEAQRVTISESLQKMAKQNDESPAPEEHKRQLKENLESMTKMYNIDNKENFIFPGMDGTFKPTKKQAEKLMGAGQFEKYYNEMSVELKAKFPDG